MKHILLCCIIFLFMAIDGPAQVFPSKWYFGADFNNGIEDAWRKKACVKATERGDAVLRVVKADGSIPENCQIYWNRPVAGPVEAGDCILTEFPDADIPAGSFVEFDLTFSAEEGAPSQWVFEYYDGEWIKGRTYKIYASAFENCFQCTSVFQTVRLRNRANGTLKLRMRALESLPAEPLSDAPPKCPHSITLQPHAYMGACVNNLGIDVPKDTLKVLCIGNSFTYYYSSPALLREIAWKEGHYIDMTASLAGGATFGRHLESSASKDAVSEGGFDLAILQDNSIGPVSVGKNKRKNIKYLEDTQALVLEIMKYSPDCDFLFEYRSSATSRNDFYGCGSLKAYNATTLRGTRIMARNAGRARISHIAEAFMIVRRDRPDIQILAPDGVHPSMLGAYLKSCVNYLTIYGEKFGPDPADCGISQEYASYLRSVAEYVVF